MNSKQLLTIIIFSGAQVFLSCNKICKDQALQLELKPAIDCPLKTQGYYYSDVDGASFRFAVFYLNGLMINGAFNDVIVAENFMMGKSQMALNKNDWALFEIATSQIRIASRIPRPCGLWAELGTGRILNDTTFVLEYQEIKTKNETKTAIIHQEYHFKAFPVKPDSTDKFIN